MRAFISFGELRLSSHTLFNGIGVALAVICAVLLLYFEWRRRKRADLLLKEPGKSFNYWFALLCFAGAYGGLALGTTYIGAVLTIDREGVAFVGGVLVFIPVFLLLAKIFPRNGSPTKQLEVVLPVLALQHVFNRIACLLNGCCFGTPFEHGITYPRFTVPSMMFRGQPLFPTQPVESAIMLLCFVVVLILHFRGKRTLPIVPLVFGATGFWLTFLIGGLVTGENTLLGLRAMHWHQIAFTLMFGIGVFFLVLVLREAKKQKEQEALAKKSRNKQRIQNATQKRKAQVKKKQNRQTSK